MHRVAFQIAKVTKTSTLGFHTSATSAAISRLNLPAMSPTMTEGTIHKWKLKEGDSFAAGDILLELETDKAQIDVEAPEDGILAKIILPDGGKGSVNSLIALLAEEGDDISSVEIPAEEGSLSSEPAAEEAAAPAEAAKAPATQQAPGGQPISHHDLDTSQLKKPLSPAVLSLVLKYGIKDLGSIQASGNGGRILKGDVLAHLNLIKPKPAPKPTLSIAPPRDQIVFAKSTKKDEKKKVEAVPTFMTKEIKIDHLERNLDVMEFIAKAAKYAVQDVTNKKPSIIGDGRQFRVFNLAEPSYDFITDSYQASKPYVLSIGQDRKSKVQEVDDLIGYLAGEVNEKKKVERLVQIRLDGDKVMKDEKAKKFLHRMDHYIRNPNELQ